MTVAAGSATGTQSSEVSLGRATLVVRPDGIDVAPTTTSQPAPLQVTAAAPAVAPLVEEAAPIPEPVADAAAPAAGAAPAANPVVNRPPPRPDRRAPTPDREVQPATSDSTAVHGGEFADPYVLRANGAWWAFGTQSGLQSVPAMRSTDLLRWEPVGDALGGLPGWAEWGHSWAPSVLARSSTFVLYYTTRHRQTGLQCISRAVAVLPQGPYQDDSAEPLVCQPHRGGSIDPSPFVDAAGTPWLLWKSEGTLLGEPTRIWVQQLTADGLRRRGKATQLMERALPWEEPIIEAPSMVLVDGRHHLFYSGNRWETSQYAVGHAMCATVTGPCWRTSEAPVLQSRSGEAGPGGQEVLVVDGHGPVLVHHAWDPGAVGYPEGSRRLHLSELHIEGEVARVGGPWREDVDADVVGDVTGPRNRAVGQPVRLTGMRRSHH